MAEFLKIWFSDIENASDFFDGNQKHLGEFLVNVYRSYAELPTNFSCKQVEKYFKTYSKQIEFVKQAKKFGKNGAEQRINNQADTQHTLEDPLEGGVEGVLEIPFKQKIKDKSKKIKDNILPKGGQDKSVYAQMTDIYFAWYEKNYGMKPKYGSVDVRGIKELCEYLEKNTDGAAAFFKNILDKWNLQDKFIQSQIKPNQIYSNINQIIAKLSKENPKPKEQKQIVMKHYPNAQLYYADCLLQKQRPVRYGSGEQLTDQEIDQEFRIYKVGKYQYA